MKRSWAIGLLIGLLAIAAYLWNTRPGHTPPGQPALVEVGNDNVSTLQAEFNRSSGSLRIIVLLSPT